MASGFCWLSCSAGDGHWRSFKDPGAEESICVVVIKREARREGEKKGREEAKSELESNISAYSDDSPKDCINITSAQEDKRKIKGSASFSQCSHKG